MPSESAAKALASEVTVEHFQAIATTLDEDPSSSHMHDLNKILIDCVTIGQKDGPSLPGRVTALFVFMDTMIEARKDLVLGKLSATDALCIIFVSLLGCVLVEKENLGKIEDAPDTEILDYVVMAMELVLQKMPQVHAWAENAIKATTVRGNDLESW